MVSANESSPSVSAKVSPIEIKSGVFEFIFFYNTLILFFLSPPPSKHCKLNICLAIININLVIYIKINQPE